MATRVREVGSGGGVEVTGAARARAHAHAHTYIFPRISVEGDTHTHTPSGEASRGGGVHGVAKRRLMDEERGPTPEELQRQRTLLAPLAEVGGGKVLSGMISR